MAKNPLQQQPKRKKPEEIVSILADKYGVSQRYVQMIISGDRNNENILIDYLEYKQEYNKLLEIVKQVVPFDNY